MKPITILKCLMVLLLPVSLSASEIPEAEPFPTLSSESPYESGDNILKGEYKLTHQECDAMHVLYEENNTSELGYLEFSINHMIYQALRDKYKFTEEEAEQYLLKYGINEYEIECFYHSMNHITIDPADPTELEDTSHRLMGQKISLDSLISDKTSKQALYNDLTKKMINNSSLPLESFTFPRSGGTREDNFRARIDGMLKKLLETVTIDGTPVLRTISMTKAVHDRWKTILDQIHSLDQTNFTGYRTFWGYLDESYDLLKRCYAMLFANFYILADRKSESALINWEETRDRLLGKGESEGCFIQTFEAWVNLGILYFNHYAHTAEEKFPIVFESLISENQSEGRTTGALSSSSQG